MTKKPVLAANGQTGKRKTASKTISRHRNSTSSDAKNMSHTRSKSKISRIADADISSEELEVAAPQSSGEESQDEEVVESDQAVEENGVEASNNDGEEDEETKKSGPKSKGKNLYGKNEGNKKIEKTEVVKSKGKKRVKKEEEDVKNKGMKRIKKEEENVKGKKDVKNKGKKIVVEVEEEEDDRYQNESKSGNAKSKGNKKPKREEEDTEKCENVLYTFPMNRIKCIIKDEIPDLRVSQEAVFLINIASEKFLQLFSKEAYACTFLDQKSYTAYNHLSAVVSKRKRFGFLSDFVPEKVKAEDALAQLGDDGKLEN